MKRSGGNRRQARLGNVNGPGREISRAGPEKFFEKIRISLNRFPENANTTNSYKRGNEYLSSPFLYLACSPSAAGGVCFGFSLIFYLCRLSVQIMAYRTDVGFLDGL